MTANILDGSMVAGRIKEKLSEDVKLLQEKHGVTPGLAAIIVGNDEGSKRYVRLKVKDCGEVGIRSEKHEFPEDTKLDELLDFIGSLNSRPDIHGILMQLPLPARGMEKELYKKISTHKDVDCFNPFNIGLISSSNYTFDGNLLPCTPKGILRLLDNYGIGISGKLALVIGRSNIVGEPVYKLLKDRDATLVTCHSKTPDEHVRHFGKKADIIISCVGRRFSEKPFVLGSDMVKEGAVVIDVANSYKEGKVYGDVDFEDVKEIASYITPVPGGVGPMTRVMLMENTIIAAKKSLVAGNG